MAFASVLQISVSGQTTNALALQGDGVLLPKLNTTSRLALTLGASDVGFAVYDTTLSNLFIWTGLAWESSPSSGGSTNTQVIFNDNGVLSGDAGLNYDKTNKKLTVHGNMDIWNGLNQNNTSIAIGKDALSLTLVGSGANTAIGRQAGKFTNTGTNNSFFGFQAGISNASGSNNVGIGSSVLFINTAGKFNVAIGQSAASKLSGNGTLTGLQNIAIGYLSLSGAGIHDGNDNIAIGAGAMNSANNISGSDNIGIGRNVFNALSNGTDNCAIGRLSAEKIDTGASNVALGVNAFNANVSGNNNVAIGGNALLTGVTGSNNTAVGFGCLNVCAGLTNTAIGFQSGDFQTTGDSNIIIGANARTILATDSNQLVFGSSSQYVGTNGAANTYYATAGASAGYWRIVINGTVRKIQVYAD